MSASSKVANRYARVIFDLCPPQELEKKQQDLKTIVMLIRENAALELAFLNPATPIQERIAVARDLANLVNANDSTLANAMETIVEHKRVQTLPEIAAAFSELVEQFKKIKSLEITTATKLSDQDRNSILSEIQKDFGQDAIITWTVSPEILGGILVKAGDLLLDGSIKSKLEQIRSNLIQ